MVQPATLPGSAPHLSDRWKPLVPEEAEALETADVIHALMVDEARRHRLRLSRRHGTRRHAAARLPWDVSPGDR